MRESMQAKHTVHATAVKCGTAFQLFVGKICLHDNKCCCLVITRRCTIFANHMYTENLYRLEMIE